MINKVLRMQNKILLDGRCNLTCFNIVLIKTWTGAMVDQNDHQQMRVEQKKHVAIGEKQNLTSDNPGEMM